MMKDHSLTGFGYKRKSNDFYPTPQWVTRALMDRETFEGTIWECASGNGAMAEVIGTYGYSVFASDLRTGKDVYGNEGIDFLKSDRIQSNIITNPPFKLAEEFVEHGLKLCVKKLCLLAKLSFLEGQRRYTMFKNTPLKTVYVFSKRPSFTDQPNKGLLAYAWFVWEKGYVGDPVIKWIEPENKRLKSQKTLI